MGEAAPPIFDARAIPNIRALEKRDSDGRLRSIGFGRQNGQIFSSSRTDFMGSYLDNRKA